MTVRVLLVDTHDESRAGLAERLRRTRDVELVGEARDAQEAAQVLGRAEVDVVLLDLHRNDRQPDDLCRALRGLVSAPVAVLASFMTAERWGELQRAGATELFLKYVDTDGLGRALVELGTKHRRHSPSDGDEGEHAR